ncbi:hypothetical protein [Microbulbifer aestuariivivens]|uniref:hypothetical protein n=1 Tax=Microbulbifer aestuariivivens TaxID=1908308 RepID=UPI0031E93F99
MPFLMVIVEIKSVYGDVFVVVFCLVVRFSMIYLLSIYIFVMAGLLFVRPYGYSLVCSGRCYFFRLLHFFTFIVARRISRLVLARVDRAHVTGRWG